MVGTENTKLKFVYSITSSKNEMYLIIRIQNIFITNLDLHCFMIIKSKMLQVQQAFFLTVVKLKLSDFLMKLIDFR